MVAARSKTKDGRAKRSYYGIDIHELMSQASKDLADNKQPKAASPDSAVRFVEEPSTVVGKKPKKTLLWTEKYRARSFMDLCGDDGTNRMVLRWLKRWDSLVFPGAVKAKHSRRPGSMHRVDEDKPHRKILMLTGPPGLGKTTLAHVCARQAGYEVLEVNASDDRSRDVVKNRIRTSLGTQSVKTVTNAKDGKTQRPARPMCVIVDEVDGVTSGSDAAVGRLKTVFEKEGIPCEKDAARKLCEAAWGIASGIDAKRGAESTVEGDLRGVMVVGEWVAGRFRSSSLATNRTLTRQWIESNILHDLSSGAAGARGLGRGSTKDIINRLFQEGGGFPKQAVDLPDSKDKAKNMHEQPRAELGFGEQQKKYSMERLSHMINTSGEIGNIVTGIFAEYPNREFNDDCYLTKPNHAYDWLHFHDMCQSRLKHFGGFDRRRGADVEDDAGPPMPFSGPRADYEAREAEKQSRAQLQALQAQLSPSLMRVFRSAEDVAAEFLPYLVRMVSPDVKPVVVGGSQGSMASVRKESERALVRRASEVLAEVGIALVKGKIENETTSGRGPQFVYRMDPDLDALSAFETGAALLLPGKAPTRYAVRQVLDQELQRTVALREATARQARFRAGNPSRPAMAAPPLPLGKKAKTGDAGGAVPVKRDFFGRVVEVRPVVEAEAEAGAAKKELRKVWVTFHEGLNNAVRKPISVEEFMRGL
ncbi:ATPase family associated with various cellular activities (AAA) domain-containing protein [Hirsutella rhossiliensis]|uniref:ATPase family associated with various cellular activities (AAA) domain-containing protein n=1 Tax=Hirsutella rhossiliensis TaxID=111463 RepID=A0A9P8SJ47_9HYPO|nr:ATPase family associated with various cellular activities (AAA) domain-containing protein [Hirsutella rhossiliensis]KAH0964516.1 ATPase family associated with various cellular activities (AAA) domain-containing protein [Hirsutella rhossiliensis]